MIDEDSTPAPGTPARGAPAPGTPNHAPIAIIGVSGRYPAAATPDQLWDNLMAGVDAVGEWPADRWDRGFHHPDPQRAGRVYTRAGGFLANIDEFDAEFFGLSPREARQVDPQQRLLLELAWEAFEDAALPAPRVAGSDTGVFIGLSSNDYANLVGPGAPDAYSNTGSSFSIASNRISYFFDLHGPSVTLDTACSSALVAIHQACRHLDCGDCETALAGAVSILTVVRPWLGFAAASMLSPTGRCRSFDAGGDGYVRSEGGGMVVLKTLAKAERDGDNILGVIRASGVNSDGRTLGLSMPNGAAQESLLRQIYTSIGMRPEAVAYVEAHGTGTAVGDPIECGALGRVLGEPRTDGSRCLIGSVKSNIGHLEPAAGIAGLTKALLILKHRMIPANLHFVTPNPRIPFDEWKLEVVSTSRPLPQGEAPAVIGVNSFGFGGTNAHLVLQEYRPPAARTSSAAAAPSPWSGVLLLSAHSPKSLNLLAARYVEYLRSPGAAPWQETCAATALSRSPLRHRLAVAADSAADAADRLERHLAGESPPRLATGTASGTGVARTALVFSGNGPQWWGMGRELLAACESFRAAIAAVDAIFAPLAGWSLLDEMQRPESDSRMALTEYAQPMLFAQQVALTDVLGAAGVSAVAVVGHSVGEAAAAYASGALTLEQATRVIYHRSVMQARTRGLGTMAAVGVGRDEAADLIRSIPGWLEIAASNSPRAATVAGDPVALEQLQQRLTAAGKFARVLPLQYPFHTTAMDPIRAPLLESLQGLTPATGRLVFVSTVEGRAVDGAALGADYWWRNVREPVRFKEAIDELLTTHKIVNFIEIGPHPVLRDYVQQCIKAHDLGAVALTTLRRPSATRHESDVDNLWNAICASHAQAAIAIDQVFQRPAPMPRLPLFTWQRARHWRGFSPLPDFQVPLVREHPLLGYRIPSLDGLWENALDTTLLGYLLDHRVQGAVVFPAAGHVENLLAAGRLSFGPGRLLLENFEILRPMTISSSVDPRLQLSLSAADGTFEIRSRVDVYATEWTPLVRGRLSHGPESPHHDMLDLAALAEQLPVVIAAEEHYRLSARRGLEYGPAFQGVVNVRLSAPDAIHRTALAEIHLPSLGPDQIAGYLAHPAVLDSCIQAMIPLIAQNETRDCAVIPIQIERTLHHAPLPNHVFCHVRLITETERSAVGVFEISDENGAILMMFEGARCTKANFGQAGPAGMLAEWWRPDVAWAMPLQVLPLPTPAAVAKEIESLPLHGVIEAARRSFDREILPKLDRLIGAYAAEALTQLGARDGVFDLPRLMRRGRVNPEHSNLLARLLEFAVNDGVLHTLPSGWQWNADAIPVDSTALWRELLLLHPALITELQLIAEIGGQLPARLRADTDSAVATSQSAADALFDNTLYQIPYNQMAAAAIMRLLAQWPVGAPIRILEVGAGRGALTAELLPLLPPHRTDYVFSDVSEAVLGAAEHRFSASRFVRFARVDLGADLLEQGLPANGFDLVIAGNALHLADDVETTLAGLRALLTPGGHLLMINARGQRLTDLVFGQVPAWWTGTEANLGRRCRLPSHDAWQELLSLSGFASVATLSGGRPADADVQAVWLAQTVEIPTAQPGAARVGVPSGLRRCLVIDAEDAALPAVGTLQAVLAQCGTPPALHLLGAGESLDENSARALLEPKNIDEIIYLVGVDSDAAARGNLRAHQRQCMSLVRLVQAMEASHHDHPLQLTVVARGALPTAFGIGMLDPAQAPLWGLARVIANEHPSLACRLIDLHGSLADAATGDWLGRALSARDAETEVQLVDGRRYVSRARLTSLPEEALESGIRLTEQEALRLDFTPHGGLDSLHVRAVDRRAPAPGEVEVRVHAAGLNFRDVLWTMGMLPEEAVEHGFSGPTIGMECAGEIIRVGAGVDGLEAGDRVIAFASSCFASHVTTTSGSVAKIPDHIDYAEAATIPTAFLTAYYALDHLARIQPGEIVLIHGAAGGVGLAALQIALLKGARVIGTAGSEAKRRLLCRLGAEHALSSRSLDFADEVMALTGGADIVLNSLAGEAITKGLQILKPFGRFLEIGKRDLYANSRIGLRPFRQNVTYYGIDADTLLIERPRLARQVLEEVMALFADGKLRPIPFCTAPIARAAEAFRSMQQSRHIGKIVVTVPADPSNVPVVRAARPLSAQGTWLVTGGLGGFGLATAHWLVTQGVRSLALVGRRGAATEEARAGIAALESAGAAVRIFALDVADAGAVRDMIAGIRSDMAPLRGVVHAAAVIEDAPVTKISDELFGRVLAPKLLGALNLHEATRGDALEMFVSYSSSSVLVGNPGQGCYVAGNLYLEALSEYRRAHGQPALAIGWGAIKDAGFLTRNAHVADMLRNRSGLAAMPVADALLEFGRLHAVGARRVTVAHFNMQRLGQTLPSVRVPRFLPIIPVGMANSGSDSDSLAQVLLSTPEGERQALVLERLTQLIARILGTGVAQITPESSLAEMGLDSLMAVELAEAVEQEIGQPVSVMHLLGAGTVHAIVDLVLRTLYAAAGMAAPDAAAAPAAPAAADLGTRVEHADD